MKRRRFLAGGVTGAAFVVGCVGRSPSAGSGPDDKETEAKTQADDGPTTVHDEATVIRTGNRTATATTTDEKRPSTTVGGARTIDGTPGVDGENEIERRISLAGVDDVPEQHRLTIEVKLLESTVTTDHTARLRVTTTNKGAKRQISIADGRCSIFNRGEGESTPPGLWLYRPEDAENFERDGHRWRRDRDPNGPPRGYAAYGCNSPVYATGDSITSKYLVWDDYRTAGYMNSGTYRFAVEVFLYDPNNDVETPSEANFTWGFDLAVANHE